MLRVLFGIQSFRVVLRCGPDRLAGGCRRAEILRGANSWAVGDPRNGRVRTFVVLRIKVDLQSAGVELGAISQSLRLRGPAGTRLLTSLLPPDDR